MSAYGTRVHMSAERGPAATQNRVENFQMEPGEPLCLRSKKLSPAARITSATSNRWPLHLLRTVAGVAIFRQGQRIERACSGV